MSIDSTNSFIRQYTVCVKPAHRNSIAKSDILNRQEPEKKEAPAYQQTKLLEKAKQSKKSPKSHNPQSSHRSLSRGTRRAERSNPLKHKIQITRSQDTADSLISNLGTVRAIKWGVQFDASRHMCWTTLDRCPGGGNWTGRCRRDV